MCRAGTLSPNILEVTVRHKWLLVQFIGIAGYLETTAYVPLWGDRGWKRREYKHVWINFDRNMCKRLPKHFVNMKITFCVVAKSYRIFVCSIHLELPCILFECCHLLAPRHIVAINIRSVHFIWRLAFTVIGFYRATAWYKLLLVMWKREKETEGWTETLLVTFLALLSLPENLPPLYIRSCPYVCNHLSCSLFNF